MQVTSRTELKEYCLRELGKPVIHINVDDDQLEDRIDDALQFFQEFHFAATDHFFFKHQLTQADIDNGYIIVPSEITTINRVLSSHYSGGSSLGSNTWSAEYQYHLNEFLPLNTSVDLIHYSMTMQHMALIDNMLGSGYVVEFSRYNDTLHIHNINQFNVDEIIMIDCHRIVKPDEAPQVYNDRFLKKYTTALIKKQWGANLIKFEGMTLVGGVQFSGRQLFDDARDEIEKLEEEMRSTWELPVDFIVG